MKTTERGRRAESAAKTYLEMRGFSIIEQNFRRPRCEIDIVAMKNNVVHLVEVIYRHDDADSVSLEAITATKLRQMRFAADIWVEETKWHSGYVLSTIEITGEDYSIMSFVENAF
jgi:putative endonuclease